MLDAHIDFSYKLPDNIKSKYLFQSPACAIVNSQHPLAHEKSVTQKDLLNYPMAVHAVNENDLRTVNGIFDSQKPKVTLSSNNLNFVYNYIAQNDCIAISFEFMQMMDIFLQNDLVLIPIRDVNAVFYCLFNANFPKQALLEKYVAILEEYFNNTQY